MFGESTVLAGFFAGDVHVAGDLTLEAGHTRFSLDGDAGLALPMRDGKWRAR